MSADITADVDPLGENVRLDAAIISKLPPNCKVLSVTPSGESRYVKTVRIEVELEDGSTAEFFKKGAFGATGASMMKAAFEAESAVCQFIPHRVPKPVAWGTYTGHPEFHFYLSEFVDMADGIPKPTEWATAVSALHLASMGKSPTGQFGFHVTTHLGIVPVNNTWNPSWESFWAQRMKSLFDQEEQLNGPDDTLAELREAYFEEAIPRYLRPLESEGRSVIPCLLHSDLWPGNIKPRQLTGELCLFDTCAYWGHYEADLAVCYNPRYKLGEPCSSKYQTLHPASEPITDFDMRNALYAMKYHVLLSTMYHGDKFRETLISELRKLLGKSDPEDFEESNSSAPTQQVSSHL